MSCQWALDDGAYLEIRSPTGRPLLRLQR